MFFFFFCLRRNLRFVFDALSQCIQVHELAPFFFVEIFPFHSELIVSHRLQGKNVIECGQAVLWQFQNEPVGANKAAYYRQHARSLAELGGENACSTEASPSTSSWI